MSTTTYPLLDSRSRELLTTFQVATQEQLTELNDRWNEPGPATSAMRLGIQRDADEWALQIIRELLKNASHGMNMLAGGIRVYGTGEFPREAYRHAMCLRLLQCLRPYFQTNPTAAVYFLEGI